jgi:hypothetical protein
LIGGKQVARASQRLRTAVAYDGIQAGLERLRSDGWLIVQTAAAAAVAWLLAAAVLHHQQAGFAPIGAVIAVEVTRGQQVRHAIELVLGVTLGVGVAALLGSVIGNPPLRIAVVVGVAMTLALLISGSLVLVVQASLAAIFLAATPTPTDGLAGERPAPEGLVAGVRVLAETVRTLGGQVVAREPRRAAQRLALQAAAHAMTALEEDGDLAVAMVVGQVRSTVLDLLRCSGMELADAQQALDEAAGPAIEEA